jgi:hypothetical protein
MNRPAVVAWSLWGLWAALSALALVHVPAASTWGTGFMAVGYATAGAMIAARRPDNAVGWIMLALALTFTVQVTAAAYAWTGSAPGSSAVAWMSSWFYFVWVGLIGVFLPLLFPDGRPPSRRWRPLLWVAVAAVLIGSAGVAFRPGRLTVDLPAPVWNPLGAGGVPAEVFTAAEALGAFLFVVAILGTGAALVVRFRRASGTERQQLKWFALAAVPTLGGLVVGALAEVFPALGLGWLAFLAGALVGIPVATGVAMFRHHLYDVDLVINRTLVYGALTATLLATYVGSVLLLRLILSPVTGDSDFAVAVSTLAAAALFRPARRRIQKIVDRRFYRRRYDATRTLEDFTTRLRHQLDLDTVGTDLCTAAHDTVQPAHVSLWIRP